MFFPYSYQVSGLTMVVPRENARQLDIPLEEAMRFIVTAGAKAGAPRQRHAASRGTAAIG